MSGFGQKREAVGYLVSSFCPVAARLSPINTLQDFVHCFISFVSLNCNQQWEEASLRITWIAIWYLLLSAEAHCDRSVATMEGAAVTMLLAKQYKEETAAALDKKQNTWKISSERFHDIVSVCISRQSRELLKFAPIQQFRFSSRNHVAMLIHWG